MVASRMSSPRPRPRRLRHVTEAAHGCPAPLQPRHQGLKVAQPPELLRRDPPPLTGRVRAAEATAAKACMRVVLRLADQAHAAISQAVDNSAGRRASPPGTVRLPVGSSVPAQSCSSYDSTTFKPVCGQPAHAGKATADRTPAARARRAHRRTELTADRVAAAADV